MSYLGPWCAEDEDLQYLAHLNEPNIARDLDLIRNLMGLKTLDFYGFSDGSVVGVTYAGMFPNRVGRMILDGIPYNEVTDFQRCPTIASGWGSQAMHSTITTIHSLPSLEF